MRLHKTYDFRYKSPVSRCIGEREKKVKIEMCRECGRPPILEALHHLYKAYPREFRSYTVNRASPTPSKIDPSFSSRDETQKGAESSQACRLQSARA